MIWFKSITDGYLGNEPINATRQMISQVLDVSDEAIGTMAKELRAKEGMGSSLKHFKRVFLNHTLRKYQDIRFPCRERFTNFEINLRS